MEVHLHRARREGTGDRKGYGALTCLEWDGEGLWDVVLSLSYLFRCQVEYEGTNYDFLVHGVSIASMSIAPSPRSKMIACRKEIHQTEIAYQLHVPSNTLT